MSASFPPHQFRGENSFGACVDCGETLTEGEHHSDELLPDIRARSLREDPPGAIAVVGTAPKWKARPSEEYALESDIEDAEEAIADARIKKERAEEAYTAAIIQEYRALKSYEDASRALDEYRSS